MGDASSLAVTLLVVGLAGLAWTVFNLGDSVRPWNLHKPHADRTNWWFSLLAFLVALGLTLFGAWAVLTS